MSFQNFKVFNKGVWCIVVITSYFLLYVPASAAKYPEKMTESEIRAFLSIKKFDDLHSLEDDDGNRIKSLSEAKPVLTDVFSEDGSYVHFDDDGEVSDRATFTVRQNQLCMLFEFSTEDNFDPEKETDICVYVVKQGNCYRQIHLASWYWDIRESNPEKWPFILVPYGETPNCEPLIS